MKPINQILDEIDALFDKGDIPAVESLLTESLEEAEKIGDQETELHLLNELIGYYRQLSRKEELLSVMAKAGELALKMGLKGSIPYATTLLNIATGYRSIGELQAASECYDQAEEIYREKLPAGDMLFANFYNNRSLLCQELGEYGKAESFLLSALEIVEGNNAGFETAVTYANLANTGVLACEYGKAQGYALEAIRRFEERGTLDPHYCAALSALGICYCKEKRFDEAKQVFTRAMHLLETTVGKNAQYERMVEYLKLCEAQGQEKGLELCRAYYETYGKPMIHEKFPAYEDKIAVGLVGEGSDCFGYDDVLSRDHDWGPGFCMWVSDETYEEIGEQLREEYEKLPREFQGYRRMETAQGAGRRGVMRIRDFYSRLLGAECPSGIDWSRVEDYALAAAVNGEVYADQEGIFTGIREELRQGYPEHILYLKLAEDAAKFSQTGQYNYFRMLERGDGLTADLMLAECMEQVMRLLHHMDNQYPPHKKWLYESTKRLSSAQAFLLPLEGLHACLKEKDGNAAKEKASALLETLGQSLATELYRRNLISDIDPYLDHHTEELLYKASIASAATQELVDQVVRLEFQAFDQVKNEGGRAYCQNDWPTFRIMRKSQYLTWNREMLLQYLYDFTREFKIGHNLITEKYGRMMESTAPERYAQIAGNFPELSPQKKAVIQQIVAVQMEMVESFAKDYPKVVGNARRLHTYEDNVVDTSYETYLRGEISTYSDKMLQLYGSYVVDCAARGINIARQTIENTARLYGYGSLEEFEAGIL